MSNTETTLPSGAKLSITPASFEIANELRKAIMRALKGVSFDGKIQDISQMDVNILKEAIISVGSDDEIEKILFQCFARVTYDGVKIEKGLFDDLELGDKLRSDYHNICWKVIEANVVKPFFSQTFSGLKTLAKKPVATPA